MNILVFLAAVNWFLGIFVVMVVLSTFWPPSEDKRVGHARMALAGLSLGIVGIVLSLMILLWREAFPRKVTIAVPRATARERDP